jgi:GAF domain-containing protein
MQRVAEQTLGLIPGADGVMIGLADHQGVSYLWAVGATAAAVGTRVHLDGSLSGLAIRTGQMVWSDDTTTDLRADEVARRRLSIASTVCIPLLRGRKTLGVMAVTSSHVHAFTAEDVALLTRLADSISVTIASAHDLSRASTRLLELAQA